MTDFSGALDWVGTEGEAMRRLVEHWASINSGTENLEGVGEMARALREAFSQLGGESEQIDLPKRQVVDESGRVLRVAVGPALRFTKKREAARLRVFLAIHMDTVYGANHAFQSVEAIDGDRLRGPGVADAKGGLAVMLTALRALERTDFAEHLSWQVLINPDEEIGSPSSAALFAEAASEHDVGLVFEPALPDGALVGQRRGSGNFTAVFRGQSAHAGREPEKGRNAVAALARFIVHLEEHVGARQGVWLNVARVTGGGALNVVPDLAVYRFNVRVDAEIDTAALQRDIEACIDAVNEDEEGIAAELHGFFHCPPKPITDPIAALMREVETCGQAVGVPITWRSTGGVCDGNKLAAAGLPTIDTLGPVGGALHSAEEYLELPSLVQRAKLTALLLLRLAAGEARLEPITRSAAG